jgi:hypothetical protein
MKQRCFSVSSSSPGLPEHKKADRGAGPGSAHSS